MDDRERWRESGFKWTTESREQTLIAIGRLAGVPWLTRPLVLASVDVRFSVCLHCPESTNIHTIK